jgi:hypothetical protein
MTAASVSFRAKVRRVYNADETLAYEYVPVPKLGRSHCDMNAFRSHRRFGAYANSDLFPAMLRRAADAIGVNNVLRLDRVPEGVTVDTSGFLAVVSFDLD